MKFVRNLLNRIRNREQQVVDKRAERRAAIYAEIAANPGAVAPYIDDLSFVLAASRHDDSLSFLLECDLEAMPEEIALALVHKSRVAIRYFTHPTNEMVHVAVLRYGFDTILPYLNRMSDDLARQFVLEDWSTARFVGAEEDLQQDLYQIDRDAAIDVCAVLPNLSRDIEDQHDAYIRQNRAMFIKRRLPVVAGRKYIPRVGLEAMALWSWFESKQRDEISVEELRSLPFGKRAPIHKMLVANHGRGITKKQVRIGGDDFFKGVRVEKSLYSSETQTCHRRFSSLSCVWVMSGQDLNDRYQLSDADRRAVLKGWSKLHPAALRAGNLRQSGFNADEKYLPRFDRLDITMAWVRFSVVEHDGQPTIWIDELQSDLAKAIKVESNFYERILADFIYQMRRRGYRMIVHPTVMMRREYGGANTPKSMYWDAPKKIGMVEIPYSELSFAIDIPAFADKRVWVYRDYVKEEVTVADEDHSKQEESAPADRLDIDTVLADFEAVGLVAPPERRSYVEVANYMSDFLRNIRAVRGIPSPYLFSPIEVIPTIFPTETVSAVNRSNALGQRVTLEIDVEGGISEEALQELTADLAGAVRTDTSNNQEQTDEPTERNGDQDAETCR